MMQITRLEVQKRNKQKVNLYLDGTYRCPLTAESVVRAGWKCGTEIDEGQLQEVLNNSESEIAFNKACDYLSRSMKTSKQMRDYLLKKGFDESVAVNVLNKLKGYNYIDDKEYARLYVNQNSVSKGARRLRNELATKGISKAIAESATQTVDHDLETDNAAALADKYMSHKENTLDNLVKLQRYLLSRGYDFDAINTILRHYKQDL